MTERRKRPLILSSTLILATAVILSACNGAVSDLNPFSTAKKVVVPPCPVVRLLKDADKITQHRAGPGKDITDIVYEGDLTGFRGNCEYLGEPGKYTSVVLTLRIAMDVTRGPANRSGKAQLSYFVAIPEFYPAPSAKTSFTRTLAFQRNRNSLSFVDDEVVLRIPLSAARPGPKSAVVIGFSLTPEQLEFNRRRGRATSLGG